MPSTDRKQVRTYFYEHEQELFDWLKKKEKGKESFIKEVLEKVKNNQLIEPEEDLMREKLLLEIRIKKATARIKEQEALYWETFGKSPSYQGQKAIKQSFSPDNSMMIDKKNCVFKCPKCTEVFRWGNKSDLTTKIHYFVDHWYKNHHGDPPQELTEQLAEISESFK